MHSSYYQEVQPERDVSGPNFPKGQINFNWTMDNSSYFNPYKTYIKIRVKFENANQTQPIPVGDNIAPNQWVCDNLFQQMRVNLNNMCLSEIGDYVPQIAGLKNRMYKSREHNKNYLEKCNLGQTYFTERQQEITEVPIPVNGGGNIDPFVGNAYVETTALVINAGRPSAKRTIELIWRPPLGFFDIDEYLPGCQGLWNLQLTPLPNLIYQQAAVQTSGVEKVVPNTNYNFTVESMNMYLLKGMGPPIENKKINLRFKEVRCQTQNLTTNSIHQKTFQVHPRTEELTLAFQVPGASIQDNRYCASQFVANKFETGTPDVLQQQSDDLYLTRFWITFGNRQLPTPIPDPRFNHVPGDNANDAPIDYFRARWNETLMYANALNSPEDFERWIYNGPYYHFSGYSENEKDDRVYVSQQFSKFNDQTIKPNVLLFDHWVKKCEISIEGARVRHVKAY